MIVRIMADGQYRIDDDDAPALAVIERLDGRMLETVEANNARAFQATLAQLINHVHRVGHAVADTELVASDVIVPPSDMTLEETETLLVGAAVGER